MERGKTGRSGGGEPALVEPPNVMLSETRAAYLGPGLALSPHRNAVATLAIALESAFELRILDEPESPPAATKIAVIPPDTLHHLVSHGAMLFLYLDAHGDDYARIDEQALRRPGDELARAVRQRLETGAAGDAVACRLESVCRELGIPARPEAPAAIRRVLRAIDRDPREFPSLRPAAELAGLSESRFRHVFRETVGASFRRYRLWKRMAVVGRALQARASLTTAALEAGFSSSAHLSAAFRTMFGIAPSDLLTLGTRFEVDRPT